MRVNTLAAAVALTVALGGCFIGARGGGSGAPVLPVEMTQDELVGLWQERRSGAELVFGAEGEFSATNLPYQKFEGFAGVLPDGFDPTRDKLPASGQWMLQPPGASSGPRTQVYLGVRTLAGRPTSSVIQMRAERFGSGPVILSFYIGDPDVNDKVVYEKCRERCPTAAPSNR